METIRATFFQECEEQLAELETGLLAMEEGQTDQETVNAVFRAVHSVKGGAGAFSLDQLVRFAHVFETSLDDVRAGRLDPTPDLLKVMLRAADVLSDLVRAARDGGAVDEARCAAVGSELSAFSGGPDGAPAQLDDGMAGVVFTPMQIDLPVDEPLAAVSRAWAIRFKPRPELYGKANEAALLLRELGRLGEIRVELCCDGSVPLLPDLDPEGAYLAWDIVLETERDEAAIREVFEFVDEDCELDVRPLDGEPPAPDFDIEALLKQAQAGADPAPGGEAASESDVEALLKQMTSEAEAASPSAAALDTPTPASSMTATPGPAPATTGAAPAAKSESAAGQTIRVDLDRVDRLIDLVGELVINQAMLSQRVTEAGMARGSAIAMGLDELEQLSREIQDSVMAIRAQPVKSVFQRMPRLVREVAAMTGKQVRLHTEGEGTEVDKTVIERLADPLTHMIRNAIDHGLESPEKRTAAGKPAEGVVRLAALHRSGRIVIEIADDGAGINRERVRQIAIEKGLIAVDSALSEEETDNLIFLPGFSTASEISDISGRGVGMDVVKRSIQALGGRISIASRPGRGSTFTMSLPLTLAVLDGMVVSVAEQTLVAPLTAIIETLQPKASQVQGATADARVVNIRGVYVPLIDVGLALGYRQQPVDPTAGVALLIENEGGSRAALLVDGIQGQRQVVIKSLEANYRQVPGIAAATILGDGRVALILDIDVLVAVCRNSEPSRSEPQYAAAG